MGHDAASYEKSDRAKHVGLGGTSLLFKVRQWIKFEEELSPGFGDEVARLAHGEKLFSCIQCGTCSSTCPVSHHMDFTPRKIISMVREGFEEEVLGSFTIWLCASCYSCSVNCPKQIKITDVMYALKQKAIAKHIYPKRFPVPVLAEEFYKIVGKQGRNNEGLLMMNLARKTNPLNLIKFTRLGRRLLRTGRFSIKQEHVENRKDLQTLMQSVERAQEAGRP